MGKRVSEMTPEELTHHRELTRVRQQRRRAKLTGEALQAYRAQSKIHQERYVKRKQGVQCDDEGELHPISKLLVPEAEASTEGDREATPPVRRPQRRPLAREVDSASDDEDSQQTPHIQTHRQCPAPVDSTNEDDEQSALTRKRVRRAECESERQVTRSPLRARRQLAPFSSPPHASLPQRDSSPPREDLPGLANDHQGLGPAPPGEAQSEPSMPMPAPESSRRTDLVTGILGVQVNAHAPIVQWTSGQRTILPYLPKYDRKKKMLKNLLSNDADHACDLAALPEAGPLSQLVLFLDKNFDKRDLLNTAREALSLNKVVVIKNYVDTHSFDFTIQDLEDEFMISQYRPVEAHDMELRVKKFNAPHVNTTVGQFVRDITNPMIMRVALGFPLPQYTAPYPFEKLDDGLGLGWAQTQMQIPLEGTNVPADAWTVRSWGLGHHGGIVTYPHHDAEGASTFAIVLSGAKNWVVMKVKEGAVGREDLGCFLSHLSSPHAKLPEYLDRVDAETIHLHPGDLMIMPPGQYHTVYTPVAGFSRGGHFYNLDTMHLTELSRFVDTTTAEFVTNDYHHGTLETLCRLVISLTILPESRKLYKRSLVALCAMVSFHPSYLPQGESAPQESPTFETARTVANAVLNLLELSSLEGCRHFLSQGDMFDRGEEVDLYEFLHAMN